MSSFCWQVAELSAYLEEMDVSSDIWMCYTHCLCPVQGQVLWKKPRQLLCPAWLRKCGHRTTRSEQDTGVCREKRGLTNVACKSKRPWLPASVMLSGLLTQNNPGAACLAEEAKSFPVPWTQTMPSASSDLCLHPELPSVGTVVSRHPDCPPYPEIPAPF